MNQSLKNYFNKSIVAILSVATLLATTSSLTSAEECVAPGNETPMNQKANTINSAPICVDDLKVKDRQMYDLYMKLYNMTHENNLDEVQKLLAENKSLSVNAYYINHDSPLREDFTLLYEAVRVDNIKMCELLIEKGIDVNFKNKYGETILNYCVDYSSNNEIFELLIRHSSNINFENEYNKMPLSSAVKFGKTKVCKLLIDAGAIVNAKDDLGYTFLHEATFSGEKEICELLINAGANVHATDNLGNSPLHEAAFWGKKEICKLLIEKGANVNAMNDLGNLPLHLAVFNGKKEICELLINNGSKVNVANNKEHRTPLDNAYKEEIKDLLKEHGAKYGSEL